MKKILLLVLTFSFWTSCGQNSTETKKKIDIDYSIIMLINNDSIVKKIVNRLENACHNSNTPVRTHPADATYVPKPRIDRPKQ